MQLDDQQRNAMLREMGIQTYVPRQPLPGARASMPGRLRVASAQLQAPPEVALAVTMSAPPAPANSVERSEPPVSVVKPLETARFAFAYIPVNEQLAVINELPWARSASLSPSCRQLLADMLKAIGVACDAGALSPMVFTWPLSDTDDMPADAESARHMLEGFLSRRLKLRPVRYLMVLGEQSAGFLFPPQAPWQANADALQTHPRFPVELVITHSLNAMEAVRELKRPVWLALQPLKQALAQSAQPGMAQE